MSQHQINLGGAGTEPQSPVLLVVKCRFRRSSDGFENRLTITGQSPFWQGQYKGITHGFLVSLTHRRRIADDSGEVVAVFWFPLGWPWLAQIFKKYTQIAAGQADSRFAGADDG